MRAPRGLKSLRVLSVAVVLAASSAVLAAERAPVLPGLEPPSPQPQGYWICVSYAPNGTCAVQKTCIRWQGGVCNVWLWVNNQTGAYGCYGLASSDCSVFFRTSSAPRGGPLPRTWTGSLEYEGRPLPTVQVAMVVEGAVVLVEASSEVCGAVEREALAQVALWASRSPEARAVWSRAGCTVTVANRDFWEWLRHARQDAPHADGAVREESR